MAAKKNQFSQYCASAKISFDMPKEQKKFISVRLRNEKKNFENSLIFKGVMPLKSYGKKT